MTFKFDWLWFCIGLLLSQAVIQFIKSKKKTHKPSSYDQARKNGKEFYDEMMQGFDRMEDMLNKSRETDKNKKIFQEKEDALASLKQAYFKKGVSFCVEKLRELQEAEFASKSSIQASWSDSDDITLAPSELSDYLVMEFQKLEKFKISSQSRPAKENT
jgi:hypothetical protein